MGYHDIILSFLSSKISEIVGLPLEGVGFK
jgi:hypothetical protein